MKHKVGDRVKVKSIEWYNTLPKEYELIYGIREKGGYDHFVEDMSEYCGRIVEISEIVEVNKHEYYRIKEDYEEFYWSDYMFEEEVEENDEKIGEWIEKDNLIKKDNLCCKPSNNVISCTEPLEYQKIIWSKTSPLKTELVLGDEYEIINEGGVTYVVRKDPYPKTYNECCEVLGIKEEEILFKTHSAILDVKFKRLYKLYICRNAYWKIADYKGQEAGTEFCWLYYNTYNREIEMENGEPDCSMFMSFPDEYVADKFIKYFGDLLEDCKEFL